MPLTDHTRRIFFSRTVKCAVGISVAGIAVFWWGGNHFIASRIEKSLVSGADKGGLVLDWKTSSWDPWRGLHLTGLRLRDKKAAPLAELENLNLSLPIHQIFAGSQRETRWTVSNSDVTLHDPAGMVKLEKVSIDLKASNGEIQVLHFKSGAKGLTTELEGKIIFDPPTGVSSGTPVLNLAPVRATLATLDVSEKNGPFHVTGNFTIDLRNGERHWLANLGGTGRDLEWKGVRWKFATAQGTLTSTASEINYDLHTSNGFTRGIVSKPEWHDSPFTFKGELGDSQGHKDVYHGDYHKRTLTVESLKGTADLNLLSQDVPALASPLPRLVTFKTFPMVELRDLVFDSSSEAPRWSFASLVVTTKEGVTITRNGRETKLRELAANAAYNGDVLSIKESAASVFNGRITVAGNYRDGVLRQSKIGIENIKLAEIRHMIGTKRKASGPGVLSLDYQGNIDFMKKRADGAGSIRLENAPVLEVPLLDQVYDIFMELIPGIERAKEGTFDAKFRIKGDTLEVTKFEARGGSLTVSAVGEVDLDKHRVSGRARGKLVGLPGLVTKPLSRLLEMDVAGPYEDIRVKPLGPAKLASNTASGTVGVVVDTIEETGKIAGTVISEGVKLPFRLFQQDKEDEEDTE